jgi:hypothetical protein
MPLSWFLDWLRGPSFSEGREFSIEAGDHWLTAVKKVKKVKSNLIIASVPSFTRWLAVLPL